MPLLTPLLTILNLLLLLLHSPLPTCLASNHNDIPYYTLEEHWVSPALAPFLLQNHVIRALNLGSRASQLLPEVGPLRLASMDANNILIQTISHVPVPEALYLPNLTAQANDQLAARIAASPQPSRFRGFCILPMGLPGAAAEELRRCVRELGFVGALVDALLPNRQAYDAPAYDELWEVAVKLDVPIYLHPTPPNPDEVFDVGAGLYAPAVPGEYSEYEAASLGTWAWGWHERVGLSFIKMYLGGVFERFPGLQVVLGHMGELVPFFLDRTDRKVSGNRSVTFREVWGCNVYVTTSGMFSLDPMTTVLRTTDTKRIMYSVDWPLEFNEDGTKFMAELRSSGLVSEKEFEDIAFKNAKRLLRI
ncbi:2-amino-3-carboxymuconate-6-semialdehyde decarboxylase [Lasiodiplodia theobromae]|uniref:2-amino-3-carboxymuconate-6-semialdehyde decarboxylase n=1 Tax=Lasiodiplodia theobromae TaxID=45133 RepID=UPI0015C376D0|nr:2-amino-3-carboxymuconate-6-semialdehyde decarboxylase [Lasiodiplodia theobromae]KAF4544333.1 2-amino-3-carboxymuconate-6-semialdehyde decarboxylase [Lasiodiplodia theobromae]